jgi:hypothetical protein
MSEALACDIVKQDCATLYPSISLNYTSHSCVRDLRYDWGGTVGRCGWPGAECSVLTTASESNCGRSMSSTLFISEYRCPTRHSIREALRRWDLSGVNYFVPRIIIHEGILTIFHRAPGDICESPETCNCMLVRVFPFSNRHSRYH